MKALLRPCTSNFLLECVPCLRRHLGRAPRANGNPESCRSQRSDMRKRHPAKKREIHVFQLPRLGTAACAREATRSCLCLIGGAACDRRGSARNSDTGRQSSAEEIQGQEEGSQADRDGRAVQHPEQAVPAQVQQGEVLAGFHEGVTVQHVAHRVEPMSAQAAEGEGSKGCCANAARAVGFDHRDRVLPAPTAVGGQETVAAATWSRGRRSNSYNWRRQCQQCGPSDTSHVPGECAHPLPLTMGQAARPRIPPKRSIPLPDGRD